MIAIETSVLSTESEMGLSIIVVGKELFQSSRIAEVCLKY